MVPLLRSEKISTRVLAGLTLAALAGAFIPDVALFVMWGMAKLQSIPEKVIWGEWYYSHTWQRAGAVTNSAPLFLLVAMVAYFFGGRIGVSRDTVLTSSSLLFTASLAALLHVAADFPLHVDDGHPHFWPLSNWIFSSPVSYWDTSHHAGIWMPIEFLIALMAIVFLWRRFEGRFPRFMLVLSALSYGLMIAYWYSAFG